MQKDSSNEFEKQFHELKNELNAIGLSLPGSIHSQYRCCGKENCRCHQSKDQRHGPYYLWYRKVKGKLTTMSIDENEMAQLKIWITNRECLEVIVEKMLDLSARYAVSLMSMSNNSKSD
jgi:hypothetical protein